jgi:glucosamine-6-phosphate deaminase
LTRFKTPWLVGDCIWTQKLKSKAIVWLCQKTDQAILKLTDEITIITECLIFWRKKDLRDLNIMFNVLQRTITGWPGGKPNTDDT